MKKLFIVFLGLLILASCKDKEKPAIPITKITLEPNPASVAVDAKLKLTPVLTPAEASNKTLTWESSAPTIATVDSNGEVTGVTAGTATITATATDGSKVTATTALTVKNNISAIILGAEKFNLTIPADGSTTIALNNAPHTLSSIIKEVPVNITVADGATIRIGTEDFTQGQKVDFSNSQTFTVSVQNGATTKFIIAITAYHATTNPYGVYTVAHLNDVRNGKSGSYKLMNDLTLPALNDAGAASTTGIEDYAEKGWLPIVHDATVVDASFVTLSSSGGFTGTFDGGNFSINNLHINRTIDFVGLFGVTSGATLKDLGITGTTSPIAATSRYAGVLAGLICRGSVTNCHTINFSISFTAKSKSYENYFYVGGLVGRNYEGTISNCYATGSISTTTIPTTTYSAAFSYVGGLVGSSNKKISNCYATGSVSVSVSASPPASPSYSSLCDAGGLVGYSYGEISNSYATGSVSAAAGAADAGGLVGTGSIEISNCYATGSVSVSASIATAGGLAGTNYGTTINCYAEGSVSASNSSSSNHNSSSIAGGLVGRNSSAISNSYASGSVSASNSSSPNSFSSFNSQAGGLVGIGDRISNSYATGSVSASSTNSNSTAGGLAGSISLGGISNSYATGSVSASHTAGGLVGKRAAVNGITTTFSNCYRNSEAQIKKGDRVVANPDDASFTGIAAKSKKDMQTDAFTTSLNKDVSVWGRSSGKNDDLPYIKGVGVGKN